jgi:hypothetical protein
VAPFPLLVRIHQERPCNVGLVHQSPESRYELANREIAGPGDHEQSLTGFPAIPNLCEVLTQRGDDLLTPAVHDIPAEFFERDVDDIVVVEFLGRDLVAEFEPDAMEQIDFFRGEPWGVWTKIENFFLAIGRVNFQS